MESLPLSFNLLLLRFECLESDRLLPLTLVLNDFSRLSDSRRSSCDDSRDDAVDPEDVAAGAVPVVPLVDPDFPLEDVTAARLVAAGLFC